MKRILAAALAAIFLTGMGDLGAGPASAPASAPAVRLGVRYTDAFRGFSLCPPAIAQRVRETSTRRLVGWVQRDEKTHAIRWSMEVLQTRHKPIKLSISEYAEAVAKELAKGQFKVKSTQVGTVAGKPAMHFRGIWSGALTLWRRQTWIRTAPGEHLVLNIAGATSAQAEMDGILTAMAGSVKLFDPTPSLVERGASLKRGSTALGKLSEKLLREKLEATASYFTIQRAGKAVGFLRISESMAQRERTRGAWIVRCGTMEVAGGAKQLTREELFATPDRSVERCKRILIQGESKITQETLRDRNALLAQVSEQGRPAQVRRRTVPETLMPAYLPRALDLVALRLIDLSKPHAVAFAVYNPVAHDFDMRTIRIVGPEKITLGGRQLSAIRLTDQMAADAPVASVWVDSKGLLLRMRTADGMTLERVEKETVIRQYAPELLTLDRIKP